MTEHDDLASAKRTINKEIEALRIMENELNDNLNKALDLMKTPKGALSLPAWVNPDISATKLPLL